MIEFLKRRGLLPPRACRFLQGQSAEQSGFDRWKTADSLGFCNPPTPPELSLFARRRRTRGPFVAEVIGQLIGGKSPIGTRLLR